MTVLTICGILVGVAVGVGLLVRVIQHVYPHAARREHNDVAGFVYAVLGVLFALMLGFVVVNEWEGLVGTKNNTFTEANEVAALFWTARALPASTGRALEATTRDYATVVIDTEWPLMAADESSPAATNLVYRMRDEINALPTTTLREQALYEQALDHVTNLAAARRDRIDESGEQVPPILWVVLIVGAVLTVGYSFLFGLAKFWSHVLIAAPLGVMVVLSLVVIAQLSHPFGDGMVTVGPDAFRIFLERLPAAR